MPWVRKDDQMPIHRKVAPLSDAAYRLLDEAICWSSRNLTDGVVRADELDSISKRGLPKLAAELVSRRLWHEAGHHCESDTCPPAGQDGWVIHDYWDYQPPRQQVEDERRAKADRMRKWREAKRKRNGASSTPRSAATDGLRDEPQNGPRDALRDLPPDGPRDAVVAPTPSPSPPRPEGKRGGDLPVAPAGRRQAADAAAGGRSEDPIPVVRRHQPEPWPDEDPQTLAAEADDIRRTAEALVAEAHQQQKRNSRGAAAARAALPKTTPPSLHGGGLDRLRTATPDVHPPTDELPAPSTDITSEPGPKPEDHPKEPHAAPAP